MTEELVFPLGPADVARVVDSSVPAWKTDGRAGAAHPHGVVAAIGAFDGLHLGHRELIASCVEDAAARGAASVVITFDPDPSELLAGDRAERRLLCVEDRVAFCHKLGVDEVLVLRFDKTLAAQDPACFMQGLCERLGTIHALHVGSNFHFGTHGAGNVDTLRELGQRWGYAVVPHELVSFDGKPVSSTRIRALLAQGSVDQAACLLGRQHFVRGTVAHGRGEGTSFGFPTANVCCDVRSCMPAEGVYACIVTDGRHAWPAAANVGAPPTFSDHRDAFLEANLIGFEGDLYGSDLAVIFVAWLRASRPFSSLEELEQVVLGNIDWVRRNVGDACVEVRA